MCVGGNGSGANGKSVANEELIGLPTLTGARTYSAVDARMDKWMEEVVRSAEESELQLWSGYWNAGNNVGRRKSAMWSAEKSPKNSANSLFSQQDKPNSPSIPLLPCILHIDSTPPSPQPLVSSFAPLLSPFLFRITRFCDCAKAQLAGGAGQKSARQWLDPRRTTFPTPRSARKVFA